MARHIVAQFGGKGLVELFAAMPPFEMIKYLLVRAVGGGSPPFGAGNPANRGRRKVLFIDVSKAHLYAPTEEDANAYVALPPECAKEGVCGRLNFWLYGMRPASKGWESEYRRRLVSLGFTAGRSSPCCFHRESDGTSCVVHGDDFTFEGEADALSELPEALRSFWVTKVRGLLGPDKNDDKEISILNRVV